MENMALWQAGMPNNILQQSDILLPAFAGPAPLAQKLDRAMCMVYWGKAWRVSWLDSTTVPLDFTVVTSNVNHDSPAPLGAVLIATPESGW